MKTSNNKISIEIFAMPMQGCDPARTWKAAFLFLSKRLYQRYGEKIDLKFIELYSPEAFEYQKVMNILEEGKLRPPYVFLNDRLISHSGKLSERVIAKAIDEMLGQLGYINDK